MVRRILKMIYDQGDDDDDDDDLKNKNTIDGENDARLSS